MRGDADGHPPGEPAGPGDGWFKKAVAQTRHDWKSTRRRLDGDRDGRVARAEFAGSDADFQRLDRDRDGSLGERDFDFSAHALTPSPGRSCSTPRIATATAG